MSESLDEKIKELEKERCELAKEINLLDEDDPENLQTKESLFAKFFVVHGQLTFYKKMGEWGNDFWQLWEKFRAKELLDREDFNQILKKGKEYFDNLNLKFDFGSEPTPADTSWPIYQAVKNLLIADQLNNAVYTVLSERERRGTFVPFSEEDDEDVEKMFVPLLIVKSLVTSVQEEAACSVVEFLVTDPLKYEDDED